MLGEIAFWTLACIGALVVLLGLVVWGITRIDFTY